MSRRSELFIGMTTAEIIENLKKYVTANGSLHEDECPGDDTCDCAWAPVNASADLAIRALETREDWKQWIRFVLAGAPSPPPDISDADLRVLICKQWDALEQQPRGTISQDLPDPNPVNRGPW